MTKSLRNIIAMSNVDMAAIDDLIDGESDAEDDAPEEDYEFTGLVCPRCGHEWGFEED